MNNESNPKRHTLRTLAAALLASSLMTPSLQAQTAYPERPVTVVVPYPAGGSTDTLGRALAERLGKVLRQTVVIENKPGAATNIAGEAVARAKPDGYTLLLASSVTLAANPALFGPALRFNPLKDFTPIARLAATQLALVVPVASPIRSLADLTAKAKAAPGKLSAGSFGTGSSSHMALELYKSMAGTFIVHVPYRGSAPAMQDLIGGHLDTMYDTVVVAAPMAQAGRVRALAVTGTQRANRLPDVPTMAESGLKGYELPVWFALVAPAGLPAEPRQILEQATAQVLAEPDFQQKLLSLGFELHAGTGADVTRDIQTQIPLFKRIVDYAQITP